MGTQVCKKLTNDSRIESGNQDNMFKFIICVNVTLYCLHHTFFRFFTLLVVFSVIHHNQSKMLTQEVILHSHTVTPLHQNLIQPLYNSLQTTITFIQDYLHLQDQNLLHCLHRINPHPQGRRWRDRCYHHIYNNRFYKKNFLRRKNH